MFFGCGCFDIIHVGHVRYFEEAKKLGDMLVIGVNNDDSVRKLKGADRPIIPENERAEIVYGIKGVDYVFLFPETNVSRYLRALEPHIFVKGNDWTMEKLNEEEKDAIRSYNGEIAIVPTYITSSTSIIERIKTRKS